MNRSTLLRVLMPTVWLGALMAYIFVGVAGVPFHADEATIITMSRDYAYRFLQADGAKLAYSTNPARPDEQQLRLINGSLFPYATGLAWHLSGFDVSAINEQWDWGADWNYNQSNGHAPSAELLLIGRNVSAFFLSLGCLFLFALMTRLSGRPAAYLASAFYALHPALILQGRRAMNEGVLVGLALATLLCAVWFLQRRSWWSAVALGCAAGLALASKHTNLFLVGAVLGWLGFVAGLQAWRDRKNADRKAHLGAMMRLVVVVILMAGVFLWLNPAWWDNPAGRIGEVLRLRQTLLNEQTQFFGGYANWGEKVAGFFRQALLAEPQYFEVKGWDVWLADAISHYQVSVWRGVYWGAWLTAGLALVGWWALWRGRLTDWTVRGLLGLWVAVIFVTTFLLTPLEWQRYYIPVYPVFAVLVGLGGGWLWECFRHQGGVSLPSSQGIP